MEDHSHFWSCAYVQARQYLKTEVSVVEENVYFEDWHVTSVAQLSPSLTVWLYLSTFSSLLVHMVI